MSFTQQTALWMTALSAVVALACPAACGSSTTGRDRGAAGGGGQAGEPAAASGGSGAGQGGAAASGAGSGARAGSGASAGEEGTAGEGGAAGEGGSSGEGGSLNEAGAGGTGPVPNPACEAIDYEATLTSHLRITADNECEVFVNGSSVGTTASWPSPVTIDVSLFVHPSRRNVIAIRGTNTSSQGGNDRGVIGELTSGSGTDLASVVVTDSAWLVSSIEEAGWSDYEFDASDWIVATEVASHGDAPWGALFGSSSAKWIWSGPVPASTNDKPNLETAYARRDFYFALDGKTLVGERQCPTPEQ